MPSLWSVALVLLLVACSAGEVPTAAPTFTLIPATITDTPTPTTPTATLPALPGPADVVTPHPSSVPVSAVAAPLVNKALDDLAQSLDVDPDTIQLILLESATWRTVDLGCGEEHMPWVDVAIEGFRIVLRVGDETYEYHSDSQARVRRCQRRGVSVGSTQALLEVDPIAAELAALAQRRLAAELDLPVRRIRVVHVMAVTWTDNSLGCPLPGEEYVPIRIEGYRIVLMVGGQEYIFHTDVERVIPCNPANERLPG